MDKEEFRVKLEEINHLVEIKDYKGAMNVVDSIDWRRVRNVRTLCVVGEIYAANKRYEDSKEIFLLAYHRASIGKSILYRLIEVSLKMGDIDEAEEFYEEFKEVAPNDNTRFVLLYKIYKAKRASLSEQIQILEEYKEKEFTEKWSYELAKLYYKAGDKEKCLDLCNEIVLWFSEGTYVMKALDLKMRMGALTGLEREKYEQKFVPKLMTPEEVKALSENEEDSENETVSSEHADSEEKESPQIESIKIRDDRDLNGAETLQEKISKGIRDIFGAKKVEDDFFGEEVETKDEETQEEMIKGTSSAEQFENVPDLEPEDGKVLPKKAVEEQPEKAEKPDFSATIKMPSLKIPQSMRNMGMSEAPQAETAAADVSKDFDFNLEDTILAAASAQGIEIPDDSKKAAPVKEEPEMAEAPVPHKPAVKARPVVELEEEEFLSEEDLQEAEAEFLNGPSKKPAAPKNEFAIPDLEPEEMASEEIRSIRRNVQEDTYFGEFEDEAEESGMEFEEAPEEPVQKRRPLTQEEELEQFIESIQPKDETDPLDIIPRERELREEEKQLFTYFVKVPGMKEQLIDTLCDAQMAAADKTSKTGNIIVMGARETGKTRLISSLIPAICKELNIEASKVAYVFADQINGKDIASIVDKLSGGFLVIENANQLTQETVAQLDKAMEFRTDGMTVIIEDEKIGMRKLIARFPKFAKKFTSMINIPVFTNDELVNFAKVYTKENGYVIDQMGMLALYNQIGLNQKEDEPMSIGIVKELIDGAIAKSKGGIKMFKRSKKRVDHDGYNILFEKDFQ